MRHDSFQVLGNLADVRCCSMCEGDGFQLEEVWIGGEQAHEHEVDCYACQGRGVVVSVVCGRCGEQEQASADDRVDDHRICTMCGHDAPNYLWLPMGSQQRDHEEIA